jgi:hypothetical protein
MNKNIENCLYQAGLTAQGCWDELDDYAREGIEKFAELIVRKCADVAKETRWAVPPSQEQIARGIQQHFGVRE